MTFSPSSSEVVVATSRTMTQAEHRTLKLGIHNKGRKLILFAKEMTQDNIHNKQDQNNS